MVAPRKIMLLFLVLSPAKKKRKTPVFILMPNGGS